MIACCRFLVASRIITVAVLLTHFNESNSIRARWVAYSSLESETAHSFSEGAFAFSLAFLLS